MSDTFNPSQYKVALLAGGISGERDISLKSGEGARGALEEAGFQVEQFDPAKSDDLKKLIDGTFDVAFLCTHGRGGEDGTLQGFLETIGLPYTGPGVLASAICMDKTKAKVFYERAGIPTPAWMVIHEGDDLDIPGIIETLGDHIVVKASHEGSSIGVYIVTGAAELRQAIESAFEHDRTVLLEQYVAGREFTVVVIGAEAQALPIVEIIPKNASYDFESKYAPGGSKHVCPAELPDSITTDMQGNAVAAHKTIGCEGVSRTDFLLEPDGAFWALETNTLPGMTPSSLLPDAGRAAGIGFPDLCTMLVKEAVNRKK